MDIFFWRKRSNKPPRLHPLDDPEQQQILREMEARVEEERATLMAVLERPPRPALDLEPGPCEVRLQVAPMVCWKCKHLIKAVRGYVAHRAFVPLAQILDTRAVAAFVVELRKQDPKLSPVSHRYSKTVKGQYFAAECPDCRALFGDFFMVHEFFTEKTTCDYPSCGCDDPDLHCRLFEYHGLTLNLGADEAENIVEQNRWRD